MTNPLSLAQQANPATASRSGTVIRVDRSVKPKYDFVFRVEALHPELEQSGPEEFDLATLVQDHFDYRHSSDIRDSMYEWLVSKHLLNNCLNYQDACAIRAMGPEIFGRYFKDHTVYFWKSVVRVSSGSRLVPYLYLASSGIVALGWKFLYEGTGRSTVLRFP